MSDTVRGIALVLSVLLWSPVAPGLLRGDVPAERALVLYAGACVLALVGCSLLASLVRAYAPQDDAADTAGPARSDPPAEGGNPLRRASETAADRS